MDLSMFGKGKNGKGKENAKTLSTSQAAASVAKPQITSERPLINEIPKSGKDTASLENGGGTKMLMGSGQESAGPTEAQPRDTWKRACATEGD